ncbi:MAG: hypothetical protein LBE04_07425 [Prevotellaceae bacterium]|jgi:hypothetical protein|nr:hypothetical protein [Prevotellaceae bacterium]
MKKVLLILVIFTVTVIRVDAQDIITKKDGNEVRAKVIEIVPDAIKYKMFDNQDGPVYVLSKSEIFMIKYESGRKEVFGVTTTSSTGTATTSSTGTTTTSSTGTATSSSSGNTALPTFGAKPATTGTVTSSTFGQPAGTVVTPPNQQKAPVTQYSYQADWKSRMKATAPDLYQKYRKGSTLTGVGIGMMSAGVVMIIIGAVTGEKSIVTTATSVNVRVAGTGGAVVAIGSVCVLASTPLMIVGFSKKSKVKREYFSQYGNRVEYKSPLQLPHFELRTNGIAFVF